MCQFIETIRIEEGVVCNLAYHNRRMNETRTALFGPLPPLELSDYITAPDNKGRIKCRVVFREKIEEITYAPYTVRGIKSLQLVHLDTIDYHLKSTNRDMLNTLFSQRCGHDDVLIVKKGLLTDTSFTNIALFDGEKWFTPSTPLLEGTQRAFLLDQGLIAIKQIDVEDLYSYRQVALFNAMIPFGELMLNTENIFQTGSL